MIARLRPFFILVVALAVAGPEAVCAADVEPAALEPKTPVPLSAGDTSPKLPEGPAVASSAAPAPGDGAILIPALKGVVFLGRRAALQTAGVTMQGVDATAVPLLGGPAFARVLARFLGQPVTLARLNALTHEVVVFYREHGRPIVDVLVPEQDVSRGTVQVLVLEGRLGKVRVEGNKYFSTSSIARQIRTQPGDLIDGTALLADLAWLNQNPFRQVDLVFARGELPGETDVLLRTKDLLPLRFYTGYEDSGNVTTGEDRVLFGFNWGNAFGLDQQFNYQFMASPDFKKLKAHSGSYVIPLPWRHTLTIFGNYATSVPDLGGDEFNLTGKSWQVSLRYAVPLPDLFSGKMTQKVTAGFDFKRSNNNLQFGGYQIFNQETDVDQFVASYAASVKDRFGSTSAELELVASPGGLSTYNHTVDFDGSRSLSRAEYAYGNAVIERTTPLWAGLVWTARLTAQWANHNLLSSEQLGLGGYDTMPGYEEREANGDNGFLFANELHAPVFSPLKLMGWKRANDELKLLVFFDHGEVGNHQLLPNEPAHLVLASAGPGLRYALSPYVTVRFDYGWQLRPSGVSELQQTGRAHFGVVVAY